MKELKVKDVMIKDVIFVHAPGKKADAIKLLARHRITGLPVVKRDTDRLIGILTRKNILDHPHEEQIAMLMTKDPESVGPEASVRDAVAIMEEKRVRRLPVVKAGRLAGILTCMDILKIIEKQSSELPVEQFIKGPCVPVFEGTPLRVVATTFDLSGAYALPVLDAQNRLVGLVTDIDLFGLTSTDTRTVMSTMGLGDDEDSWNYEGVRNLMKLYYEISETELPDIPVRKVMVKDPITVTKKTGVSEAARIMREHNFRQLPVTDSTDRLQSMLYDTDLLSVLHR
jgi:CBS domain-containing protein